ncbi:hypothetical protein [Bradyrhizobium sp. LHD-71]|uniref:hypothetical protein n=1 Tax=Bradyrhizobium sp. LHD-71 TaxID=3072141 RepID=UPI00280FB3A5|nr:hypothetical protein [Bradyrhizobium sp. LHD-71]MDQ8726708.1 hypothetical protein [Bradyrhizobium sp. LHD-71]
MRATTSRFLLTIVVGLSLAGCLQTSRQSPTASATDDDTFCQRNAGTPGSNTYAACMKDRDIAREQSQARVDRAHRRVTEDMLNAR